MAVVERIEGDAEIGQVPAQAHSFKIGVVGRLDDAVVREGVQHLGGDGLTGSQIDHAHITAVHAVAKQQNLKIWGFSVFVHASLGQIHTTECFNITTDGFHRITSLDMD